MKRDKAINRALSIFFTILSLAWIYPVFMIALNSFKKATAISTTTAFDLLTPETFNGLANYVHALNEQGFASAFMYSLIITVTSVVLILVCCSMCAWYVVRVNSKISNFFYYLFVFSMVVPFQMLMFTLSNLADRIGFNTPFNICFIYLGFGAGLAVFMFAGFVKNIPLEIEEAAMIDGCNPVQVFFKIVLPIMKPTYLSVGILETMWVWNDYLLPTLVLDIKTYRTIPMAIQYFRGSYGKGGDGTHDGLHYDYGVACYRAVPDLPEIYYRWRGRRCCQGVNLTLLQERGLANDHQRHCAGVRLCGRDRLTSLKLTPPASVQKPVKKYWKS